MQIYRQIFVFSVVYFPSFFPSFFFCILFFILCSITVIIDSPLIEKKNSTLFIVHIRICSICGLNKFFCVILTNFLCFIEPKSQDYVIQLSKWSYIFPNWVNEIFHFSQIMNVKRNEYASIFNETNSYNIKIWRMMRKSWSCFLWGKRKEFSFFDQSKWFNRYIWSLKQITSTHDRYL